MNLPKNGERVGKFRGLLVWFVVLVAIIALSYKMYQLHWQNFVWMVSHSRPAEICRLENTRDELMKVKELDQTKQVLEEVGK